MSTIQFAAPEDIRVTIDGGVDNLGYSSDSASENDVEEQGSNKDNVDQYSRRPTPSPSGADDVPGRSSNAADSQMRRPTPGPSTSDDYNARNSDDSGDRRRRPTPGPLELDDDNSRSSDGGHRRRATPAPETLEYSDVTEESEEEDIANAPSPIPQDEGDSSQATHREFDDDSDEENEQDDLYSRHPPQRQGTGRYPEDDNTSTQPRPSTIHFSGDNRNTREGIWSADGSEPNVHNTGETNNNVRDERHERTSKWDVFTSEKQKRDPERVGSAYKGKSKTVLKILCIICTFSFLLLGAVVAKVTSLIAASNIHVHMPANCPGIPVCQVEVIQVEWIWCLFLILITPQVFTVIRCGWLASFKNKRFCTKRILFLVLTVETFHTIGVTLFAFQVLPKLDSALHGAALMCGVGSIPALLSLLSPREKDHEENNQNATFLTRLKKYSSTCKYIIKKAIPLLAFVVQLSALIIWPVLELIRSSSQYHLAWAIPLSLVLISVGWWENFVTNGNANQMNRVCTLLAKYKTEIGKQRTIIYLLCSMWKIVVIFTSMLAWMAIDMDVGDLFDFSFDQSKACIAGNFALGPLEIWAICSGAGLIAYFCARTASKVLLQRCYWIPLHLTTPAVFAVLLTICETQGCDFHCYSSLSDVFVQQGLWLIAVWWFAQFWICRNVFKAPPIRLMQTDMIFVRPLYDSLMLEQWLYYNYCGQNGPEENDRQGQQRHNTSPNIPQVYFCITMWHEEEKEMKNILKSVFRCDKDQWIMRNVQEKFNKKNIDYYEFEAHIFFDDALRRPNPEKSDYQEKVNKYVKCFTKVINKAASYVYPGHIMSHPVKYETPYGGRLEWQMPGGNKLVVHLKDKNKIKNKKRWSQVMYMYYFLGKRLFSETTGRRLKKTLARNTFILALDGDTDFQPEAVKLLLDLMKKDENIGAACGRIHPIGNGPMAWYQQFEYCLGHWFQKATEHVLGCVLCSPGCFSLFRGAALMDNNVLNRYTTPPTKPSHFVQYDQGEDRWLCTLLLQAGWRIEYSAASDAYTYCPEDFKEFYNQRKRWGPSTLINIWDLLTSAKKTTKINNNMSYLYFFYQGAMFVSALLGTGTIFLMISESMVVALNYAISPWLSFFINLIPLVIFTVMCFKTSKDVQVQAAMILTVLYAILQMLVLVGMLINIGDEGVCSPSAILLFAVLAFFVIAALLHPQEASNVIHGLLYFVFIPSMYMLLMIYSVCNINDVSWGTRESSKEKTEEESGIETNKKGKSKLQKFSRTPGNLIKWCFSNSKRDQEKEEIRKLLHEIRTDQKKILKEKKKVTFDPNASYRTDTDGIRHREGTQNAPPTSGKKWIKDPRVEGIDRDLDENEKTFFSDLIHRYLKPEKSEKEKQKKGENVSREEREEEEEEKEEKEDMKQKMQSFRNSRAMGFFMVNILFVTVIFTLQRNVDSLSVEWPCGEDLRFEPIGFMFVAFFGLLMLVQFSGMLCHRMGTLLQVVSFNNGRVSLGEEERKKYETLLEDLIQPRVIRTTSADSEGPFEQFYGGTSSDDINILHEDRNMLYDDDRRNPSVAQEETLDETAKTMMNNLEEQGVFDHRLGWSEKEKILGKQGVHNMRKQSKAAIEEMTKQKRSSREAPRWSVHHNPLADNNGDETPMSNGNTPTETQIPSEHYRQDDFVL